MPVMLRLLAFGALQICAISLTVYSAITHATVNYASQSKYPSLFSVCYYIGSRSTIGYITLMSSILFVNILLFLAFRRILFGPLRHIESEHLNEYGWYAATEIFLTVALVREQIDTTLMSYCALLFSVKVLHRLLKDKIDFVSYCFSHLIDLMCARWSKA